MKMMIRLGMLLPMSGSEQRAAAIGALGDIKKEFGKDGGTWFAGEGVFPVVSGWWWNEEKARLDEDPHVLVSVDVLPNADSELSARRKLHCAFTSRYRGRGVAQAAVYISREVVSIYELSGRVPRRQDLPTPSD
ncbi:hypothetical protein KJZ71_01950 [Patescibacteria group bacterium]|nr:hypothetical protein [Patescibacteria group bacterium]MDL1953262.1 hypothetical protein [Candidatus Uhrbacteria bacterium UHB]RIL00929.1 MAG: hypothetical protein DCC77_00075 [Candidatus Uhrbacteria bacterium]